MMRIGPILAAAVITTAAAQTLPAQTFPDEADVFLWTEPRAGLGVGLGLRLEDVPLGGATPALLAPLHLAAASIADPDVIATLVLMGENPGAVDEAGRTPLHVAAARNASAAVTTALILVGAPVGAVDGSGYTALHLAATPQVAAELLRGGADPCAEDATGRKALSAPMFQSIADEAPEDYEMATAAFFSCY